MQIWFAFGIFFFQRFILLHNGLLEEQIDSLDVCK